MVPVVVIGPPVSPAPVAMLVTEPVPPVELMVTAPVAPERVTPEPAMREVTPELVTTTLPVVGDTVIPVPPVT